MIIAKTSIRATLSVSFYTQDRMWNADGNLVHKKRQRSSENPKSDFQTTFVQINGNLFIKKLIILTYHFFIFHKHLVQHEYAHNMHS